VIQGWDIGVASMKHGERSIFTLTSDYAYGPRGQGPIPPDATLIFDVELFDWEQGGEQEPIPTSENDQLQLLKLLMQQRQMQEQVQRRGMKQCNVCTKDATSQCSKCKNVSYCSRECQLKDWNQHKLACNTK
jgi:hypothetical protein